MDNESKNIDIELKDDSGQVEAVFSIFNSLDSDGDVVVPGAVKSGFKNNQVPMVWSHKWDMPIGKGTITQDDDKAVFKGEFFMDTDSGKEKAIELNLTGASSSNKSQSTDDKDPFLDFNIED